MDRRNNFDFLRFVAACLVMFSHCYPLLGVDHDEPIRLLTRLENGGGFAVSTFFVLSGYLIVGSYLHSKNALEYLVKRMLRLFPALIVVVILSIVVLGPLLTTLSLKDYFSDPLVGHYFTNIYLLLNYKLPGLFADNPHPYAVNGSLWTLPIEFLMYLVVVGLGLLKGLKPWPLMLVVGFCWALHFGVLPAYRAERWTFLWVIQAQDAAKLGAFFFTGGWLYTVRHRFRPRWPHAIAAFGLLHWGADTPQAMAAFMAALPIFVMWLAFVPTGPLQNFGKLGDFSYGIYIYAFPVQQTVIYLMGNAVTPWTLCGMSMLPTLALSIGSWYAIEAPALRLKARWFHHRGD